MIRSRQAGRSSPWVCLLLFVAAGVILFLASNRNINIYDEGIMLTGAMRVAAGQVVHRDFYYNYGPANIFIIAALFKVFGETLLVSRIWWIVQEALTPVGIYILSRRLAGPRIALGAVTVSMLWQMALGLMPLSMLWSTWLVTEAFDGRFKRRAAFRAGLLVGVTTLFRYDVGLALGATHAALIVLAAVLRAKELRLRVRAAGAMLWPYLLGLLVLAGPLFAAYWVGGVIRDFLYDIVLYPAKYYHPARNTPFPGIHVHNVEDIVVYVLPILIAMAFYKVIRWWMGWRTTPMTEREPLPGWVGQLIAFGTVAVLMYMKGLVRIGAGALFMCTSVCILLAVVLLHELKRFGVTSRIVIVASVSVCVAAGLSSTLRELKRLHYDRSMTLEWLLWPQKEVPQPPFRSWCQQDNVLTKGFCFFPDDNDHLQAIEYVVAHTGPTDTLYVGLAHHDRIFANDNMTYFATQRLPATKWSHFDPFLQNRADLQQEMIGELKRNRPPLIVLDDEFEFSGEPNGSSVSTGVHLIDDYIAANYGFVEQYGPLKIVQRR